VVGDVEAKAFPGGLHLADQLASDTLEHQLAVDLGVQDDELVALNLHGKALESLDSDVQVLLGGE
jgi:hypothetical protein